MSTITVNVDKDDEYYPGQSVTGKVVCDFKSPKEVRQIRVLFCCAEHTQWIETERVKSGKNYTTRIVCYMGDNAVFAIDAVLHPEGTVSEGEHIYPFNFKIPEECPGTFQCQNGYVKYFVKAIVDRAWKLDIENEKEIKVVSPLKLSSLSPELQMPGQWSDEKNVCCLCCASGPIQLDLSLEKQAFTLGEAVNIKVHCINMSRVNVEGMEIKIKKRLGLIATSPKLRGKSIVEQIANSDHSGVGAHGDQNYNVVLEIPADTVIPNFTKCKLFKFRCIVKAHAKLPSCHIDLDVKTEVSLANADTTTSQIVKGTSDNATHLIKPPETDKPPISAPGPSYQAMPTPSTTHQGSFTPTAPLAPVEETDTEGELPPPSYEEASKLMQI